MLLADKIIKLRKMNGWSQEELAEIMNVSRQAVSKWESAHSVPDLDKILQLSELFGVTTDYLLKDELEASSPVASSNEKIRRISIAEATEYLNVRRKSSYRIAIATFLCILSPVTLFILSVVAEEGDFLLSKNVAEAIGVGALFAFILTAIPLFVYSGYKNEPYSFLDNGTAFELERDANEYITLLKNKFTKLHAQLITIGTCICIASPMPLILSEFTLIENIGSICMLAVMFFLVGIGVIIFIIAETRLGSMKRLLQEGEFSKKEKIRNRLKEPVAFCYFGILTAIYLSWSFLSMRWHTSWLIFAVGGILFPVVMRICEHISDSSKK